MAGLTRVVVIDAETTGVDEQDQVVELAMVTLEVSHYVLGGRAVDVPRPVERWSALVRPAVPVHVRARAAHHLTDEELAEAPTMDQLLRMGHLERLRSADVVVAHNLEFDARMMVQSLGPDVAAEVLPARRVCTWRCAGHLWPDAPGYSNQVLRYWLDLSVPPLFRPPHRALPDALVTASLLMRELRETSLAELERLTYTPVLQVNCTIGQWRGRPWAEVDAGMLRWILARDFSEDVRHTAEHWLNARSEERERIRREYDERRASARAQEKQQAGDPGPSEHGVQR